MKLYTKRLHLCFSEKQYDKMLSLTNELEIKSINELVRMLLDGDFMYVNFLKKLIFEKKKQGNNLNQIAYQLNKLDTMTAEDLQYQLSYIAKRYDEILDEVRKLNDSKTY